MNFLVTNSVFNNSLFITLASCGIFTTIIFFIVSNFIIKNENNFPTKSTLKNTFPCEYINYCQPSRRYLYVASYLTSVVFNGLSFVSLSLSFINTGNAFSPYGFFMLTTVSLAIVFSLFLVFSTFYAGKFSIFARIGFYIMTIASVVFYGSYPFFNISHLEIDPYLINPYIGGILLFVGLVLLILLFNPKLKKWSKVNKTEVNGTTYFLKPKINYLALCDWIYIGSTILLNVLVIINTILNIIL